MRVFIIATLTADGFIAQNPEQSSLNWSSKEDTQVFMKKTKQAGVIVMGSKTFATIKPKYKPLKDRLNIVYTRKNNLDFISEGKWVKDTSQFRTFAGEPAQLITQLEKEGFKELAVCGGASVYTKFLQAGVVDTLYLTVEPILFGNGIKLFNQSFQAMQKLVLENSQTLNDKGTLLLEYRLRKLENNDE